MKKNDKKINRRQALSITARITTAAAIGSKLVGSKTVARNIKFKEVYDVIKYGAVGDGKTLDTIAIQKAINEAATKGNAQVLIPGGRRYLIGTLELKNGIDFHLAEDAELIVSTDQSHYINSAVITAVNANGLLISGTGNINGRSLEFMSHYDKQNEWWRPKSWRPRLFVLTGCKDLQICDISFSDAPSWGLHMLGCEGVLVDNLKVRNNLEVPNCDGIDPDHCRDVEIRNCHIICGDDAVVIKATRQNHDYGPSSNITVKDCILETQDSGVKIGTETTQDIHDIRFERCEIRTSCRGLTIQLRDEGSVYNVDFNGIKFKSQYHSDPWWGRGEAISLTAIPRTPQTKVGSIHDVRIRNISGLAENSIRISGTKESRINNVTMENVAVTINRWTRYNGGLFDNRPTSAYPDIEPHGNPGCNIRYVDGISLKNCSVKWGNNKPDYFTHALEAENVTDLKLMKFVGESAHPGQYEDIVIH